MEAVYRLKQELAELGRLREELETALVESGYGEAFRADVQLVCEEALANVIRYGYPGEACDRAHIQFQYVSDGQCLTLTFEDNGMAFDPLAVEDPELGEDLDRPIGGLGIYLIKQLTDRQFYERRGSLNRLVLEMVNDAEPVEGYQENGADNPD